MGTAVLIYNKALKIFLNPIIIAYTFASIIFLILVYQEVSEKSVTASGSFSYTKAELLK